MTCVLRLRQKKRNLVYIFPVKFVVFEIRGFRSKPTKYILIHKNTKYSETISLFRRIIGKKSFEKAKYLQSKITTF